MSADLHNHSLYSDGTWRPSELVREAKRLGLHYLGLTDHDTAAGLAEARRECQSGGAPVLVPGVELSTEEAGREVHVLAYFAEFERGELAELLAGQREERVRRLRRMVGKITALGMPIDEERVLALAGPGSAGRPHIARAMAERGYVKSVAEAFSLYLSPGKPGYVERTKLDPVATAEMVRRAHGVAVLAHPGLIGDEAIVRQLLGSGAFTGVEVWHPNHDAVATERYLRLAEEHHLVGTGGSDFHDGEEGSGYLGAATSPDTTVEALLAQVR